VIFLRQLLVRLGLVVFGLSLVFTVCEIGLRARSFLERQQAIRTADEAPQSWAIYDPVLGYRLNPSYEDTNPDGLRDHPVTPKRGRFRLLLLGDSVGYYGDSIEDTYPGQLEEILNQGPAETSFDVLNASVRGYTTYQELLYLKHHGLGFAPDLVGLGFVLNDLHQFLHSFSVRDGQIIQHQMYSFTEEAVRSVGWRPRSAFLEWLAYKLKLSYATARKHTQGGFAFDYRADFNTAWKDASWEPIRRYLGEFEQLAAENDYEFFVVVFPFGQQYDEEYLREDREYVLKPQARLRAICQQLEIPFLDLYDSLDPKEHLGEDGIHLTAAGRRHVAYEIEGFLKAEGLVPSR